MPNIIQESIERYEAMLLKSGVLKGSFQHDNLHIPGVDLIKDVYQAANDRAIAKRYPAAAEAKVVTKAQYDFVMMSVLIQAAELQIGSVLDYKSMFSGKDKMLFNNGKAQLINFRNVLKTRFEQALQGEYLDNISAMIWEQTNIMMQSKSPLMLHSVCLAYNEGLVQMEGSDKPMNETTHDELESHQTPAELELAALKAENAKMAALLSSFSEETEKLNKKSVQELRNQTETLLQVA